MSAKMRWHCTI